ncbi:hypothetical protein ACFUCV_13705 [Specibacter sp. NPDC057265]|uniref:hypothetical protein n=1 Tax=Specibacter sp. NPDC057265 TaxID=3346075 RepID=UPI0036265EA3
MKKLLMRVGVQLGSSAVAILLADILLSRFSLHIGGFLTAIVVFTAAQLLLERFVAKWAGRHVPALAGLASLVSTWLALVVAAVPVGGIRVDGFLTWIYGTVIIWAIAGLCEFLMRKYSLKGSLRQ